MSAAAPDDPLRPLAAELSISDRSAGGPPGSAYRRSDGAVRAFGPDGFDLGGARAVAGTRLELLAADLSPDSLRAIARSQDRARAARLRANIRARAQSRLLRAVRRGDPPCGSLVLDGTGFFLRLPDGTGWGGSPCPPSSGWDWTPERGACRGTRVLAQGLSHAQCWVACAASEGSAARAVAALRAAARATAGAAPGGGPEPARS